MLLALLALAIAVVLFFTWRTARRRRRAASLDLQGPLGEPVGLEAWIAAGVRAMRKHVFRMRDPYWCRLDWDLQLVGPDGVLKDRRLFRNLVVNAGLDGILQRGFNVAGVVNVFDWIGIGTDATGELATDVALGTEVDRDLSTFAAGGTGVITITRTFPAAIGWEPAAIVEAGLFDTVAAGVMFSRKTFAAINKTSPDTLKVVVTVTVTPA